MGSCSITGETACTTEPSGAQQWLANQAFLLCFSADQIQLYQTCSRAACKHSDDFNAEQKATGACKDETAKLNTT